jgi:hypothetical protein
MPNFGVELHLGRLIGIFGRQLDIDLEESALVGGAFRSLDVSLPMAVVSTEE